MSPLNTGHAQSVVKSCVVKIHFVLFQNTTSDLTASNNHNAITLFRGYKENKTQRGFLLGGVWFSSPLNCSVKFPVSLKPTRGISWPFLVLSRVDGQLFVSVSSCHPGGFAFAASRGTTCKDSPEQGGVGWGSDVPQFGGSACKCLWQNLPLELCWSCHRSWSHGPPALPVFPLYEREALE